MKLNEKSEHYFRISNFYWANAGLWMNQIKKTYNRWNAVGSSGYNIQMELTQQTHNKASKHEVYASRLCAQTSRPASRRVECCLRIIRKSHLCREILWLILIAKRVVVAIRAEQFIICRHFMSSGY